MANNIKELRKSLGLTQAELAKKIGLTTSAVGMYETGTRNPSYEILKKLSNIFGVSLEEIVDITTDASDNSNTASTKSEVKLTELSFQTFQLEYIHPQKVRAKVKKKFRLPSVEAAKRVQRAVQYLLNDESFHHPEMKDVAKRVLLKDENYRGIKISLDDFFFGENGFVDGILDLFYDDIKKPDEKNIDFKRIDFIEKTIKLPSDAPKVIFLGRVGVGKSTIIKNLTNFGEKVNFPFTDTSRTTTYQTEYIFRNRWQNPNKLAVSFMYFDEVIQEVETAIDRAVEAKIDMLYEDNSKTIQVKSSKNKSKQDRIIKAFYTDPNKVFDMRFFLGKYLRTESKNKQNESNQKLNSFWSTVYDYVLSIIDEIEKIDFSPNNNNDYEYDTPDPKSQDFLRFKYYEYIFNTKENENSTYARFRKFVLTEIKISINNLLINLDRNEVINHRYTPKDTENDWPLSFFCNIKDYESDDFYELIKTFTSKEGKFFGNILTPLIKGMRIELPYNDNLSNQITEKPIIFIDTVGTSHVVEEGASIENSINLNLDEVDVITVADDSRTSMSADTLNILKHLTNRVARSKIFIAYTFYDEFTKREFEDDYDEDEDYMDEQKQDYLLGLQNSKLAAILKDDRPEIVKFLNQLQDKTTFMKGLVSSNSHENSSTYDSINKFLKIIHDYYNISNNFFLVDKINDNDPLVEYDYKRLAMIFFNEILENYLEQQKNIYLKNPPHYKVTEALTRRLANGETYYMGAEILKPVDDLYSIMLDNLYTFILNPKSINFKKNDTEWDDYKTRLLEELKENIFENLTDYLKDDFTSRKMRIIWNRLHVEEYGIGSDYRRRIGIIETLEDLLVPYTSYIVNSEVEHMIDKLELIFERSILDLEKTIQIEKEKIKRS
ncbi:XRE family transcriptional regulator [Peribacillus saganii]|uniref:XRE family transcriptional regulator n=1 Tax=Peribacillus saganii TaxID=2303992 RepID=A0A372LLL4_9BACI|nr:helix-turn-helix domain-containing protein [Peribacillus saganii]RFU67136.1 XRE family transcriptional regulator [Peribacillus saganii]